MTWSISQINVPTGYRSVIYGASGPAHIGTPIQGNWLVSIPGLGYISLDDAGHQQGGPHYWAVRINGSQLFWYDGQGDMQIAVNPNGSFTMNGGISGWVRTPVPNCNMTMTGGANYCFCLFSSDAGTTQTINVLAGAPRLLLTLYPAIGHAPVPYAAFSVAGPNGISINNGTAGTDTLHLTKTQKGVTAAIIDNPAAGAWAVTVSADAGVPWYLMAHVYDANDAGPAQQAYQANPQCHAILAELGFYVDPPPQAAATSWGDWFRCAWCQTIFFVAIPVLVAMLPEVRLYSVLLNLGKIELANGIAQKVKVILQIEDDGIVANIINTVLTVTDPVLWPRAICKLLGKCN